MPQSELPSSVADAISGSTFELLRSRLRAGVACYRNRAGPFRVLSIDAGCAPFDGRFVASLAQACGSFEYTIAASASYFAAVVAGMRASVLPYLVHAGSVTELMDAAGASAAAGSYDLVIVPLWRSFADWSAPALLGRLLRACSILLARGGTLFLVERDTHYGVFSARALLASLPAAELAPLLPAAMLARRQAKRERGQDGGAGRPTAAAADEGPSPSLLGSGASVASAATSLLFGADGMVDVDRLRLHLSEDITSSTHGGAGGPVGGGSGHHHRADALLVNVEPLDAAADLTDVLQHIEGLLAPARLASGGAAAGEDRDSGAVSPPQAGSRLAAALAVLSDVFACDAFGLASSHPALVARAADKMAAESLDNVLPAKPLAPAVASPAAPPRTTATAGAPRSVCHVPLRVVQVLRLGSEEEVGAGSSARRADRPRATAAAAAFDSLAHRAGSMLDAMSSMLGGGSMLLRDGEAVSATSVVSVVSVSSISTSSATMFRHPRSAAGHKWWLAGPAAEGGGGGGSAAAAAAAAAALDPIEAGYAWMDALLHARSAVAPPALSHSRTAVPAAAAETPVSATEPFAALPCARFPFALPPLSALHGVPGYLAYTATGAHRLRRRVAVADAAAAESAADAASAPQSWALAPVSAAAALRVAASGGAVVPLPAAAAATAPKAAVAAGGSDSVAVQFDPCFPCGRQGGFVNCGLAAWHQHRALWCSRPSGYAHPPYPPELDDELDDMLDDLVDTGVREMDLPGPVRLPDMIDLLLEVWSPVEDSDSDDENW